MNETIEKKEEKIAMNTEKKIRLAAFHKYLAKGKMHGADKQDWYDAEAAYASLSKREFLNERIEELCRAYAFADGESC